MCRQEVGRTDLLPSFVVGFLVIERKNKNKGGGKKIAKLDMKTEGNRIIENGGYAEG